MQTCRIRLFVLLSIFMTLAASARSLGQTAGSAQIVVPDESAPKWVVSESTYDFGTAWAGMVVTHSFKVRNEGTALLQILEARPKCACSIAENYTREIPPGGEGIIPFQLNTASKSGQVSETIAVKTNDKANRYIALEMKGFVRTICKTEVVEDSATKPGTSEFAQIRGSAASFGRVKADQHLRRVIRMTNTSGLPLDLQLVGINQEAEKFKAELKEVKSKEEFDLIVTGEPPWSQGHTSGMITFRTGIPENPEFQVGAYAYVPPRIEVVPPKMVVDPRYPIQTIRALKITNHGEGHLEVTSISCSNPDFQLRLMPVLAATPKTREISVKFPLGQYRPPRYGDVIRVETTDPDQPVIDVYVLPELNMNPEPRPEGSPLIFHPGRMN